MKESDFWERVGREGGECWLWRGAKHERGYGRVRHNGRIVAAHRLAYELWHRVALSPRDLVLHRCDTPACCRPAHLYLGTHADNARDRVARGHPAGKTPGSVEHAKQLMERANKLEAYYRDRSDWLEQWLFDHS